MDIGIGLAIAIIGFFIGMAVGGIENGVLISGGIGLVSFIVAALLSGAGVSGDRNRGNYTSSEDFITRHNWSWRLFKIGSPGIIIAVFYYWDKG